MIHNEYKWLVFCNNSISLWHIVNLDKILINFWYDLCKVYCDLWVNINVLWKLWIILDKFIVVFLKAISK